MLWYHWTFFGMHFFWWLAWIALIIAFISTMASASRRTVRLRHDESFGILQRRYAAGEITTQEYEERKRVIERDSRESISRRMESRQRDRDAPV
jgi:putative membrane protein